MTCGIELCLIYKNEPTLIGSKPENKEARKALQDQLKKDRQEAGCYFIFLSTILNSQSIIKIETIDTSSLTDVYKNNTVIERTIPYYLGNLRNWRENLSTDLKDLTDLDLNNHKVVKPVNGYGFSPKYGQPRVNRRPVSSPVFQTPRVSTSNFSRAITGKQAIDSAKDNNNNLGHGPGRNKNDRVLKNGIILDDSQIQKKFKHAEAFGLPKDAPANRQNFEIYKDKIENLIEGSETVIKDGTFRGDQPVTHYYNKDTRLWVAIDKETNIYVSSWELSNPQFKCLETIGNVQ